MKSYYWLSTLIILCNFSDAMVINEIMYNPSGNEYDFEYIELFGTGDISNYYFEGIDFQFPENTTINGYMIIANTCQDDGPDNDFMDRYNVNCIFDFKGNLLNIGETITIRDSEKIIDSITYENIYNEDHSVERFGDEWLEGVKYGSPGKQNKALEESPKSEPEPQEEEPIERSKIKITDSPNEASFGEIIDIKVDVFRGDTSKYAIYAYIEDRLSKKTVFHVKNKLTDYTLKIPIQIKPNCDQKFPENDYEIIIEGLEEEDKEEIHIKGLPKFCSNEILIYEISAPVMTYENQNFYVQIDLMNNFEEDKLIKVTSYIYRGSKKYKESIRNILIDPNEKKRVKMQHKINSPEGIYKIKIKILDGKKLYSETKEIFLKNSKTIQKIEVIKSREIIYESEETKVKQLIPYFIVVLFILSAFFAVIGQITF